MPLMDRIWMFLRRLIWGLLFFLVIAPIFVAIWFPVAIIVAAIDLLAELIGFNVVSGKDNLLWEPYEWFKSNLYYVITGNGMGDALPYV